MASRAVIRQNDFSFGELSEDHAASGNKAAVQRSMARGRNIRIRNSHSFSQRFGSRFLNSLLRGIEAVVTTSDGNTFIAHIRASGIDFCNLDGDVVYSVTGAPWTADNISKLVWHARKDKLYVAHNDFITQVVTYESGAWALSNFTFSDGVGNSKTQLYYRFADKDVTMKPSDTSGSITVEFSQPFLTSDYVGTRMRYSGREVQIASLISASKANATVIDELSPTFRIRVDDTSGFRVGEAVSGDMTGTKGYISAIVDSTTMDVVVTDNYGGFEENDWEDETKRELVVGPNHTSRIKRLTGGVDPVSEIDPAAFTIWDEQVVSAVHGYPGDVFEHAGRLGFADFPDLPDALALSTPDDPNDFSLKTGEADAAIFERIGQERGQHIRYCISGDNLFILTDKRVYYVPQSADTPLAANTFQFSEIGPTGTSTAFPAKIEGGIAYVESGGNRIMGIMATGNQSSPYELRDLSRRSSHLINEPIAIAITNGNAQAPERYIFCLNGDGTMAVMYVDTDDPAIGWVPWDTDGSWIAMAPVDGDVYSLCQRDVNGSTVYFLERFDSECQMDASVRFSEVTVGTIDDDTGDPIEDDTGDALDPSSVLIEHLAGETVHAIDGTNYIGEIDIEEDGSFDLGENVTGDFEVGLHFTMDAVLWTPEPEDDARPQFGRHRITRAAVRTQDTGVFSVGIEDHGVAQLRSAYDQGDDLDEAPPLRSETKRFAMKGWVPEPRVQILRPIPHPVHILSVAQEVAF